jgi:spermidine dehydrogenase
VEINVANIIDGQTLPAASVMHGMVFKHNTYDVKDLPIQETYDMIIAGSGISGLSAAHFYQEKFGGDKKVLILDPLNHFGGHAHRNEFNINGNHLLGYGGSESFQSPKLNFSKTVHDLMKFLKVETIKFEKEFFNQTTYSKLGLSRGTFFGAEKFEKDTLAIGDPTAWVSDEVLPENLNAKSFEEFFSQFPMAQASKDQLLELFTKKKSTLSRFSNPKDRADFLTTISYEQFLREEWKLSEEAIHYFYHRTIDFFGLPISQIPTSDAFHYGLPGFHGIELPIEHKENELGPLDEPYIYHFPDGNSSLARLLIRSLIPTIAEGKTMEDIVLDKFKTEELDSVNNSVRIRLGYTVVYAANTSDGFVDIGIVKNADGSMQRLKAKHTTLACFNMVIPFIHKDLKADQAQALSMNVKVPMVYSNVVLNNWKSWVKLGVHEIYGVNTFHSRIKLDYSVKMGGYSGPTDPSQPIVVHMVHIPSVPASTDIRAALRQSRKTFFAIKPEDFEKHILDDLTRMLGPGGFNAQTDIAAINVNRWSHGYAFGANTLIESEAESTRIMNLARQRVGNITIANSDAGWSAYAHTAIDEAYRAVNELE